MQNFILSKVKVKLMNKILNSIKYYYFKIPEILRFAAVSVLNTLLGFIVVLTMYRLVSMVNYNLLLVFSYLIIISFSFVTNKYLVFTGASGTVFYQYLKAVFVYIVNILLNAVVVIGLINYANFSQENSQIVGAIVIFVFTYLLLKHFAFKDLHFKLLKKPTAK